jgi:CBS domain-containing protein
MNCPACGHENIDGSDRCENCLAPFRDLDVPRVDSAEGLARSVMEDNLSRLDEDEPICVSPTTPALDVARQMKAANSGCALVLEGNKLLGIFTEHDVLRKLTGDMFDKLEFVESGQRKQINRAETPVKDMMSPNPETLHERDSVAAAVKKMSLGRYRHLPL